MFHFLVNPASANGQGRKTWKQIEPILRKQQVEYEVHFTKAPQHAITIVKEVLHKSNITAVVVLGGDGTIHEVTQVLAGTSVPLGLIPTGSGNDFARALKIPAEGLEALERILQLRPERIDIAAIDDRYFVNGAGIGFDGAVAKMTNESKLKDRMNYVKLGRYAYLVHALKLLMNFHPTDMNFRIDGKSYFFPRVWLVAVSNIPFYGGGMKVCPNALFNDGILDLCIVSNVNKRQFLKSLSKVFNGKHISDFGIQLIQGKKIFIQAKDPVLIHTDGEFHSSYSSSSIEVLGKSLHVL